MFYFSKETKHLEKYRNIRSEPDTITGSASGKEPSKRHGCDSRVGKIPWRRARQPTPIFLPGEAHGQRSLVGYSP